MKTWWQRYLKIWGASLLLMFLTQSICFGATQEEILRQINKTKQKLLQTKKQEKNALGNLMQTQKELEQVSNSLNYLNNRLDKSEKRIQVVEEQLQTTKKQLSSLQKELKKRQQLMDQRLISIYKYGYQNYLEILVQAKNFADFISRYEMVSNFIRQDLKSLKIIEKKQQLVLDRKEDYEDFQLELERQKSLYLKIQTQTEMEQKKWTAKMKENKRQLTKIQNDRRSLEAALNELERISKALEAQIRNYQSKNKVALGSGKLVWPTKGRISSYFGWRIHPILKKQKYHTGIDVAARSGSPIVAADSGVVIFSGNNGGYGKVVILDHGAGISTVYAHCLVLLVKKGEIVGKGNLIAKVGSTGFSTGPHLHFEVRKNGTPVNPLGSL